MKKKFNLNKQLILEVTGISSLSKQPSYNGKNRTPFNQSLKNEQAKLDGNTGNNNQAEAPNHYLTGVSKPSYIPDDYTMRTLAMKARLNIK